MKAEQTSRVITIFNHLIKAGKVQTQREFCEKIGFSTVSFNKVLKDERKFPERNLSNLKSAFGVNIDYVLKGEQPIFTEPVVATSKVKVREFSVINKAGMTVIRYVDEFGAETVLELITE